MESCQAPDLTPQKDMANGRMWEDHVYAIFVPSIRPLW